jgi:hypothetical protein
MGTVWTLVTRKRRSPALLPPYQRTARESLCSGFAARRFSLGVVACICPRLCVACNVQQYLASLNNYLHYACIVPLHWPARKCFTEGTARNIAANLILTVLCLSAETVEVHWPQCPATIRLGSFDRTALGSSVMRSTT